jgi:hypothetical protein
VRDKGASGSNPVEVRVLSRPQEDENFTAVSANKALAGATPFFFGEPLIVSLASCERETLCVSRAVLYL